MSGAAAECDFPTVITTPETGVDALLSALDGGRAVERRT